MADTLNGASMANGKTRPSPKAPRAGAAAKKTAAKKTVAKKTTAKAAPKASAKSVEAEFEAGARAAYDMGNEWVHRIQDAVEQGTSRVRETFEQFSGRLGGELQDRIGALREGADEAASAVKTSISTSREKLFDAQIEILESVQHDANRMFEHAKAMLKARSVQEAARLQTDFVRAQMESSMTRMRRIGEMSANAAKDAAAPIVKQAEKLRKGR